MIKYLDITKAIEYFGNKMYRSKIIQFYLIYSQLFSFFGMFISFLFFKFYNVNVFSNEYMQLFFGYNIATIISYNNVLWRFKFCTWSKYAWFANFIIIIIVFIEKRLNLTNQLDLYSIFLQSYFLIYIVKYFNLEISDFNKRYSPKTKNVNK